MNQSRGTWDIMENVLVSIREEAKLITHIMYSCNLNSSEVQRYVEHMINKELIVPRTFKTNFKKKKTTTYYGITPKGLDVLNKIKNLKSMIGDDGVYPYNINKYERDSLPIRKYAY